MLERVWREGNPPTLLKGMESGTATMKDSMEVPERIELPYDPALPLLSMYLEKNTVLKDTCAPVFIAGLFTIAKTWKPSYIY